jgi:hypothetical protein
LRRWWPLAALLLWVVACYVPALPGPYQFDDRIGVAVDPAAASVAAWWQALGNHVRPLLKASFVASHTLGAWLGHVPMGHRLVNLAIHLATIVMLWRLALQLSTTCLPHASAREATAGATLAAALFGLHPLATEAVSYISGRSMALGTLLACAALAAWIHSRIHDSRAWSAAALGLSLLAALGRESVVFSIPLLVLTWEFLRRDAAVAVVARPRRIALAVLPFAALAGAVLLVMLWHGRYAALLRLSWWIALARGHDASLLTGLGYFGEAVSLLRPPSIDPDVGALPASTRAMVGLIAVAPLVWAWLERSRHPQWLLAAAWALAWLLPLYAWPLRHDAVSERHMYPALWGVAWAVGVTLVNARQRLLATTVTAIVLLAALSGLTAVRNHDYRSEVALWEAAQRSAPRKVRVLNNLGVVYMEAGRWDEAARVLDRALVLDPQHDVVPWNLAAARRRDLGLLREPVLLDWPLPVEDDLAQTAR